MKKKLIFLTLALLGLSLASCGKKNSVTIKIYNLNNDGETVKLKKNKGELLSLDIKEMSGYHLGGIYSDLAYSNLYDFSLPLTDNLTLRVSWKENSTYQKQDNISLDKYINEMISSTPSYIPSWNKEGFKGRWNYIDGVFLNSIYNLYKETQKEEYKNFFLNYINYYISDDGTFIRYIGDDMVVNNKEGFTSGELDTVCESKILFDAYNETHNDKYLKAIEYTYSNLINMDLCEGSPCYNHKSSYKNQVWLDGMYMYAPFMARYANLKNDNTILDKIVEQYRYIYQNMRNDEGLYYHGMDTTKSIFWADKESGCSKSIWLRSMGWLLVSLTDIIEYYPDGSGKEFLNNMLEEGISSIEKYRDDKSKMYFQLVDKKENSYFVSSSYFTKLKNTKKVSTYITNYLESSGSSMISYAMMKSSRLGYIDDKYYDIGYETFEGVYSSSYNNSYLSNICITAGLGPETNLQRDGSEAYYLAEPVGVNDAKGVGPFIMAYIEYKK